MRIVRHSVLSLAILVAACVGHGGPGSSTPTSALAGAPGATFAPPAPRPPGADLEALLATLHRSEGARLQQAALEIALSDDPAAVDQLVVLLEGPRADVAASALALVPGDAGVDGLLVALDHTEPSVRERAASGLRARLDHATLPALLGLIGRATEMDASSCNVSLAAIPLMARPADAAAVRATLDRAPSVCGIEAGMRAFIDWKLGDAAALATVLSSDYVGDESTLRAIAGSSEPRVLEVARVLVGEAERLDQIVSGAMALTSGHDAEAMGTLHRRLEAAARDPGACRVVGPGAMGPASMPDLSDEGSCNTLGGLVLAAAVAGDAAALPILVRLAARGREAARTPLDDDVLWARVMLGDSSVEAEMKRLLQGGGPSAQALRRTYPRVAPAVAEASLPAGTRVPAQDACDLLLSWDDPRRLEAARRYFADDDTSLACRVGSARVLAELGTDDDHVRVAGAVRAEIEQPDDAAAPGMGPIEGWNAMLWAEVASKLPAPVRPEWAAVARPVHRAFEFLIPEPPERRFGYGGGGGIPSIESVAAVLSLRTAAEGPSPSRPAPALLDRVRATTARPEVAGPALARLLRGAPDEAAALELRALAELTAPSPAGRRRDPAAARVHETALGRLYAAALASGDARALSFVRARVGEGISVAAQTELARLALDDTHLPVAPLVPVLEHPSHLMAALLALRCDETCGDALRALLASDDGAAQAAAAIVAGASGDPALEDALAEVAPTGGNAGTEAAIALVLLGRANADARHALAELEEGSRWDEGAMGRAFIARRIAGMRVPPFAREITGSCRFAVRDVLSDAARGESDGEGESLGSLVTAAVALRVLPGVLAGLPHNAQDAAAEDLRGAVQCLGSAREGTAAAIESLFTAATPALKRALAPIAADRATLDPSTPLVALVSGDADAGVREAFTTAMREDRFRSTAGAGRVLERLAGDPAASVRRAAVAIVPTERLEGQRLLGRALDDPSPEVRRAALQNARIADSLALDRIASLASDSDVTVRLAAAEVLASGRVPGALRALRRLLGADETRMIALAGLARCGTPEDLRPLLDAYRRLPGAEREMARYAFAGARRLFGGDLMRARALLQDRDPEVARLAVVILMTESSSETIAIAEAAVRHRAPAVRREVAGLVQRMMIPDESPDQSSLDRVHEIGRALLHDTDPGVRCRFLMGAPREMIPQEDLDQMSGEPGLDVEALFERYGCSSVRTID